VDGTRILAVCHLGQLKQGFALPHAGSEREAALCDIDQRLLVSGIFLLPRKEPAMDSVVLAPCDQLGRRHFKPPDIYPKLTLSQRNRRRNIAPYELTRHVAIAPALGA
jgi:hypothetical protein